ncbi:MAG: hypothetical protein WDM77_12845 [Steroidobacteraceae bacterium]
MRAGVQLGELSIEPFIDNLTDTHVLTNYNWSIDDGGWTAGCCAGSRSGRAPSA